MDSINKNQPEDNHESLAGEAALKKIKELIGKADAGFFCTRIKSGEPVRTRPMSPELIDEQGHLWFLSASDSYKNQEIEIDPAVQLFFQGSAHSDFLTLYGTATISRDKNKIEELWKPLHKTWFTEGKDDPRITVIKVTPASGYYWDTKHGNAVAFVKMLAGSVVGKTLDDSVEGNLNM